MEGVVACRAGQDVVRDTAGQQIVAFSSGGGDPTLLDEREVGIGAAVRRRLGDRDEVVEIALQGEGQIGVTVAVGIDAHLGRRTVRAAHDLHRIGVQGQTRQTDDILGREIGDEVAVSD